MNKAELIQAVMAKAEISHRDAEAAVEAVFDTIVAALARGEAVKLSGFGIFEKKSRAARVGTNPANGEKIEIPASNSVSFKLSKGVKEQLN